MLTDVDSHYSVSENDTAKAVPNLFRAFLPLENMFYSDILSFSLSKIWQRFHFSVYLQRFCLGRILYPNI